MDLEGGGLELGQVVSRGHEDSEEQKFRGLGKAYSLRFGEDWVQQHHFQPHSSPG